ncbi:hypothetical protein MVEG_09745 [Podila verticillata NRRL 6337]|nr:hypothetical protein MVEG_09745 [Podila verticillata NRRL 6337]
MFSRSFVTLLLLALLCLNSLSSFVLAKPIWQNDLLRATGPSFGTYPLGDKVEVQVYPINKTLLKQNPKVDLILYYPDGKTTEHLKTIRLQTLVKDEWYFRVVQKYVKANRPNKYFTVRVVFPWKGKTWYTESEGIQMVDNL